MRKYLFHNKVAFIFLVIVKFISTIGFVGFAFVMQNIVDFASKQMINQSFFEIVLDSAIFCVCTLVAYAANQIVSNFYINRCAFLFRKDYYHTLLKKDYLSIAKKDSSKYISDLTNNCKIIQDAYFASSISLIDDITSVILSFAATAAMNWELSIIMLILTAVMLLIPMVLKKPIDQKTKSYSQQLDNYTSTIKESLLGLLVIKSYNAESIFDRESVEKNRAVMKAQNNLAIVSNLSWIISFFVSYGLQIGMMAITAYYVVRGDMTIGSVVAILSLSQGFYGNIQNFASRVVSILSTKSLNKELIENSHLDIVQNESATIDKINLNPRDFQKIEISNLNFSYYKDGPSILDNVNLTIERNKKYLILGDNGSGKSTLLKIIANIFTNYDGRILINGIEYRNIDAGSISRIISYSQQEGYLFHRTLSGNIDLFKTNEKQKLEQAIKQSQLSDFVSSLSNGADTIIDEEVRKVSGGEKLRIMIARILYHGSPVLLLDEITASLDRNTSSKIEQLILNQENKTIISVCHNFKEDLLALYDEIIILKNGRIVSKGKYTDIEKDQQFGKYIKEYFKRSE